MMNRMFSRNGAGMAGLAALVIAGAAAPVRAATVVQPDVRASVTHLDNAGFTNGEEFNATGGEVEARVKFAWVDQRGMVLLMPMIRYAQYSEDRVADREEQRLQFKWFRELQTAASNTQFDYSRQDLFSSEFRDPLDPDEIPDGDQTDSGVVDVETTRDRLHFRQDFLKEIGQRNSLAFALDYSDVSYDEDGDVDRIDFDDTELDAAWRRQLSQRTGVFLRAGGARYDGDNGVTSDSFGGGLGFDFQVSEIARFDVAGGYLRVDTEDEIQDLGSDDIFVFTVGGERATELTRLRIRALRNVRPTSTGGVATETGVSMFWERRLTERVSFGAGLSAFRQERDVESGVNNDRDHFSGKLQLDWRLSRQWFLEASAALYREDFETAPFPGAETSDDRGRFLLSIRYRGMSEIQLPSDDRFIQTGY